MTLKNTRFFAVAALLALILLQTTSAAVKPGVEYSEGAKVETPGAGASFTIPADFIGILPSGSTFFVMGSKARKSYIFALVDQMTAEEALENMTTPLPLGKGLTLRLVGKVRRDGDILVGDYLVDGSKQPLKGYIESRVDDGGLGIGYVAISSPETAAGVQEVVRTLIEETTLDTAP